MKTRNIFTAIVAALTLIVTGCQKEADHFLNEIKVSTSYLSFQPHGGTADITITAVDAWGIKDLPEWMTASAMSGSAGESTVKFTATEAEETREATFYIECAGAQQNINVIQMTEKVERQITPIGKVIEAGAGTFRVKGTIIKITSTSYGNFWMNDGTADGDGIQVYGTLNKKGNTYDKNNPKMENLNCKDNPDAWDVAPGDIITVEGPFAWYNTTPELVDVTVIAIEKSLIGVESVENNAEFPLEGGENKVVLKNKGDGFHVSIPEEAQSWLAIADFGKDFVVLRAQPNPGGDRSTTVTFSTEADGVTYTCEQIFTQKGAILEVPIADFLAAEVGDTQFRLTGVIVSNYESDKNGQSFTMRDWSGETLVYRLDDYQASGAQVGDVITVVGKRGAYKENPQMVEGKYEKHITTVKDKSLAEIAAAADDANVYYLATGILKEIVNDVYGNVWLKDDSGELYVYGCYPGWGAAGDNRKNFLATAGIEVGDKLSVIGVKGTHNEAPQIANGIYFAHEKGAGPQPQGNLTIDGNPSDWEGMANVVSLELPAGAEQTGLESAKILYSDKLYFLVKLSDAAIADGKVRLHVYFDTDETGCLAARWNDDNIDYMLEGKMTSGGEFVEYGSALYKFNGTAPSDWGWDATDYTPTFESAGNDHWYELAMDYSGYPGGLPEQFNIGLDVVDSNWAVFGFLPQTYHTLAIKKDGIADQPAEPGQDTFDYTPSEAYNAANNLWKANAAGNENYYYYNATGDQWNGTDTITKDVPFLTVNQSTYVLSYPEATYSGIWQKQFFIFPDEGHFVALDAAKTYNLKITLSANNDCPAFFKIEQYDASHPKREGACIWEKGEFTISANTPVEIEQTITGVSCENINLVFAFGGNVADTKIYIKDITLVAEGGETPQQGPSTIAEIVAAIPAEATGKDSAVEFEANLVNPAVVSYVNGGNAYIQDETGAILLYISNHGFVAGDTIKGKIAAKGYWFNGIPELVAIGEEYEKGSGAAPAPKEITLADLLAHYDANLLRLVKLSGVTVTGGISDGDRSGEITQGNDKIAVYAQLNNKGLVLTEGDTGDLVTIPAYYKTAKQVYLWDNAWFTKAVAPNQANITIDGDMSDWASVPGATGEGGTNAAFKVASDANNLYFYVKRTTNRIGDLWGAACYHYYTFDLDGNPETGTDLWGNGPYEMIMVIYPYAGSASEPAFGIAKEGATAPAEYTVENAVIKGKVTDDGVETEVAIPRSDIMAMPGGPVTAYYWSNKDGGEKLSVTATL